MTIMKLHYHNFKNRNSQKELWSFFQKVHHSLFMLPWCKQTWQMICMMTSYGYQTALLRNSHLYLLLLTFMYADMTVSPKRSTTVRNSAIFETKNILVSKSRIWLGTDGKECKRHCAHTYSGVPAYWTMQFKSGKNPKIKNPDFSGLCISETPWRFKRLK